MLGEFELIARLLVPLARGRRGALGLTDDAALLPPRPGHVLVATKDAMVAGRHFPEGEEPGAVARKLLRVNLSDLAAMGAAPDAYLLVLGLPRSLDEAWLEAFVAALDDDQQHYGVGLLGGDTVGTEGPAFFSLTALGWVPHGSELRRAGARPGDDLYVSGTIGDAAFGLHVAQGKLAPADPADAGHLLGRFRFPEPRLRLGVALRSLARAAMDVSDGLVGDLEKLCRASGVGAELRADLVPLSPPARRAVEAEPDRLAAALTGGDDYELLFAAPPTARAPVAALARELDLPLTRIGAFTAPGEVVVLGATGEPLALSSRSFTHF
jgi:thiamine-monophosphate kinase